MYNPYLPQSWLRRDDDPAPAPPPPKDKGLSGVLKGLHLDELNTGDVLLLLLLLFLFLDDREDNLELLITLGLMLLL